MVVDGALRTTNPRIWAAGDLTGHPAFTHVAGMHGSLAASNAVLGLRRKVRLDTIPRVTYTQPEVASFGVGTETDDPSHTVHRVDASRGRPRGRRGRHRRARSRWCSTAAAAWSGPAWSAPGPARCWPS